MDTRQPATIRFSIDGGMESNAENSFLWSLADLMTLLLIFFVLLYANSLPQTEAAVRGPEPIETQAEAAAKQSTVPPSGPPAQSSPTTKTAVDPATAVEPSSAPFAVTRTENKRGDAVDLQMVAALDERFGEDFYVRWEEKEPVFVLGESISFNVGDATLLKRSRPALRRMIDVIKPLKSYRVVVSGHSDNVAIATPMFPSNWELSAARAASVARYLAAHGIDPQRLIIQGKSAYDPLVANDTAENRRINRRVEISLLPEKKRSATKVSSLR